MFFIVLGHFFPPYISAWIYTFNVPLFFFMSGYLAKREDNWSAFRVKNVKGLIIPFFLLSILVNIPYIIDNITDTKRMVYLVGGITSGFHSVDGMYGCMNMWFVYCLLLVKVLFQCFSNNSRNLILVTVACIIGMAVYHLYDLNLKWAVSNVFYAFPYFALGYWFKRKDMVRRFVAHVGCWQQNMTICALSIVSAFVATYNGIAYTYEGGVGKSLLVFSLCSVVNMLFMVRMSYITQNYLKDYMRIISRGSILILAFHLVLLYPTKRLIIRILENNEGLQLGAFIIASILICAFFIPVIRFVQKHIPILIGKR